MSDAKHAETRRIVNASRRTPKICLLSLVDLSVDGRTIRQIKSLRLAGFEVTLIYHRKNQEPRIVSGYGSKTVGIFVSTRRLPKKPIFHLLMYLEFCIRAIHYAFREQADVYQGNNLDGLLPAFLTACLRRARVVYDSQEIFTDMQGVRLKSVWRMMEAFFLKRTDAVFDVNFERAKLMQQRYSLSKEPVVVMNCPELCSPNHIDRSFIGEEIRLKGFPDKRVVLYQGAIMRGRYLDNLVLSLKHLHADALLVFMGNDVRYRDELCKLASDIGVAGKVLFLDPIPPERILSFISGAEIGVLFYEKTSLNNFFCAPTKLYEYLMAGLPIVANDMPHLQRIVSGEKLGKIVKAEIPESIARGIDEILESELKRKVMAKRGRDIACTHYNWAAQADKYLFTYRNLTT